MSFKNKVLLGLISVLTVSTVGCSDFINGQKAQKEEIKFSNERLACLKDVPPSLKKFSVGEATKTDIRGGMDCMRDALIYFQKKTYGARSDAYTVEEMRRFFSKYFLKENVVTPEFAQELMKIKKALLGGSSAYLTKEEITRLVDVLAIVRDEAVELAPHVQILLTSLPKEGARWDNVSAATEQLRVSLQRLLDKTELAKSDYGFDDAKKALAGFREFIKGSEPFAPYDQYSKWIPVVEAVKNVLMGQQAQIVNLHQWKNSLDSLIDLYGLALKYHYVIQNFDMSTESKVREVSQFIGQTLDLIENCHQMKTTGVIPLEDIDSLIDTVMPKLHLSIREKSIKRLYRAAILRLLDPARRGDSRGVLGLEKKHLAALRREYNVWRLNQSFIDFQNDHAEDAPITQQSLLEKYKKFNSGYIIEKGLSNDPYEQIALDKSWDDTLDLLKSPVLLAYNSHGRVQEINTDTPVQASWASLTKSNLMRALSRGLMIAYGENVAGRMSEARLSKQGLIDWYDDFMDLMLDLKAFDPRSGNSGSRSFMEANFFTMSGNGDDWMDSRETYEFVSLLFSAGLSSSANLSADMTAASCAVLEKDIFGFNYLDEKCFKTQLRRNFGNYFDNLPQMSHFVAGLDDEQWNEFYRNLIFVSASIDQRPGLIETANIRTIVTILHYVESIMVIYDKDRNQTLSLDEVYGAAPRFMSFLKSQGKTSSEMILKQGFAYLVFNGNEPSVTDLAKFQAQKLWLGEATRGDILRVIKALKDKLNKG
ncbi:MAG: hypothetical protein J7501_02265 [Bdellovibrio sp.]|nr:hypothetical protein [Bdellovibrio sp.]